MGLIGGCSLILIAAQAQAHTPDAPTGLTVTAASGTSISLSWTAPSNGIVGYNIYRCEEGMTPCTPGWKYWVANQGDVPPAPTEYVDTDVTSGKTYRYAVTADDSDYHHSVRSDAVTATAQDPATLALTLDAITGDDTVNIAEKAAGFSISGATGSESGVSVSVSVGSQSPLTATSDSGGDWSVDVPANATYISGASVSVTVSAAKTDFAAPSDVTRTLTVDLVAPTAPTYSAPAALTVGTAITSMSPSGGSGIDGYSATGLPSGLSIDGVSGVISGTPDTDNASTQQATVTVADNADNSATVVITFPAVDPAATLAAPTGLTVTSTTSTSISLSWTAPADDGGGSIEAYNVYRCDDPCGLVAADDWIAWVDDGTVFTDTHDDSTTHEAGGTSPITADATYRYAVAAYRGGVGNWSTEVTATAQDPATLALTLDAIAGDDTVNIAEKAAGFSISGATGSESGVSVSVSVGSQSPLTATSDSGGDWSVDVPANATYISGASVSVTVSAAKTDFAAPSDVTRTLTVDLVAPTAPTYSAPAALTVGTAITSMSPSGGSGIDGYSATGLPSGLSIDGVSGVISGTPDTDNASTQQATVTVADNADNSTTVVITFPAVDPAATLAAPTGLTVTSTTSTSISLSWTAKTDFAPADDGGGSIEAYNVYRCDDPCGLVAADDWIAWVDDGTVFTDTHDDSTTHEAGGTSPITADATYRYAVAAYRGGVGNWSTEVTATAQDPATLALTLDAIAGDDTVNIAEKAAGFSISGATGSESGVSVSVSVGSQSPLTATSDSGGDWSVDVPANATYISGASVSVTVSAAKTDFAAPSDVTRTLTVDLVAPTAPTYSAPAALTVGTAITSMSPSGGSGIDGYSATGLPSGLSIDGVSGVISGTPDTDNASTQQATVTVADNADNSATVVITFPAVDPAATLALTLDAITGDDTVNIAEKAAGFSISGATGSESGVSVSVGSQSPLTATSDSGGDWSVDVPANATYISGASVSVTVSAAKTDFAAPSDVTRTLTVDLVAPTAPTYSAPAALTVGTDITSMSPSGGSGIDGYSATGLPSGLSIDGVSGVISGTPDTANASTQQATVTVADNADNSATVVITFPAVDPAATPTTTPLPKPAAPTGLAVTAASGTSISLSWTAPADDGGGSIEAYNVYRCDDPCGLVAADDWIAWVDDGTVFTDTHDDSTTHEAGGTSSITADATYRYAVAAYRGGVGNWSTEVTATAQGVAEPEPSLAAPTGLTSMYDASTNSISLSWTQPSGDIVGYSIYRCEGPPCTPEWKYWVNQNGEDIAPAPTEFVDTDVTSGTTYRYQVTSNDAVYAESDRSSSMRATAGTPPPPVVLRVIGLKATAISTDSISLSWKPSVKDVMKDYSVYRCTVPEGESTCDPYDGLWIALLENSNAYTDNEVTPGETYRYAVAVEPFRREELSRSITVVAQTPQMLAAPTGLTVTEVDESSVRLSWTAPEDDDRGPVQSIDIYRCNVDRSPDCSEFLYMTSRNPALTEYKDNDLEPGTTYRYAVAAYRSADEVSPWSNQMTATTKRGRYASPTDLTVTATFANAISLSWTAPAEGILGYNVYRCSLSGGGTNCEPMWHAWVANRGDAPPAPTSYTDIGGETGSVVVGTTYRYVVAASFPPNYRLGTGQRR